jgi:hypothetical protein
LISLPRNRSLKAFAGFLIAAILIAEYALIEHAIKHSFADADEVCFVCEKADNFQQTLTASVAPVQFSRTTGYQSHCRFETRISSFKALFHPRAPPRFTPHLIP